MTTPQAPIVRAFFAIPLILCCTLARPVWSAQGKCASLDFAAVSAELQAQPKPSLPNQVSMQLVAGSLEQQVRAILTQHLSIRLIDWQASPHHQWPTDHRVEADSWATLLRRVLSPYGLQVIIYPNSSAVVRYRLAGKQRLT
ncbi:hypothetical protein [Idiomarina xiamenensis]|uniref:Uncharacterized protein n=1 Tax=Idiomarina xiamenensis 10-D-4 TaxID=740709 RepID=K2L1V0_9GAMM|nr:hypothetical protein [Idiomarina xiamenensis]EKE83830.1 hypothetical protein A10D4_06781 [Idiomarina xiamenensis 10-D-4]